MLYQFVGSERSGNKDINVGPFPTEEDVEGNIFLSLFHIFLSLFHMVGPPAKRASTVTARQKQRTVEEKRHLAQKKREAPPLSGSTMGFLDEMRNERR
jgi:hypothetical protein